MIRQSQIISTQESSRDLKSKDLFSYTITLEGPGNTYTYKINQQELAPETEPLIQYLSKLAKKEDKF
ncbi:MAG: hypothetical protein HC905_27330 [Bacteroidales bacterium]|nr:hypothetical protein [Bacteroidales bacterium]